MHATISAQTLSSYACQQSGCRGCSHAQQSIQDGRQMSLLESQAAGNREEPDAVAASCTATMPCARSSRAGTNICSTRPRAPTAVRTFQRCDRSFLFPPRCSEAPDSRFTRCVITVPSEQMTQQYRGWGCEAVRRVNSGKGRRSAWHTAGKGWAPEEAPTTW